MDFRYHILPGVLTGSALEESGRIPLSGSVVQKTRYIFSEQTNNFSLIAIVHTLDSFMVSFLFVQ